MLELEKKTDEEIVLLTLHESEDYFAVLISRYKDKLKRYISRISNIPAEDIDDLIQDIFLAVYEKLNCFNTSLTFSSWIYRIAHNRTINFWKKHKQALESINIDDNLYLVESVFNEDTVKKDILEKEEKEQILSSIEQLDMKYKEVLVLKFLEQKDYKEISDILQKPIGTVGTLINRAKRKLKEKLIK